MLTDAQATFSLGETFPNSAWLFINDLANGKAGVCEQRDFPRWGDLGSGIRSTGRLSHVCQSMPLFP